MNLAKQMDRIEAAIKARNVTSPEASTTADDWRRESSQKIHQERQQAGIDALLKTIPQLYQGKTFADIDVDYEGQDTVKNIIMRYESTFADRRKAGSQIVLEGPSGTGKTLISLVLCQALVKKGYRVRYEPSLLFLREFRDKNFAGSASFKQLLDMYQGIDLLIIDEVTEGLVKGGDLTDWEKEMLFTLINLRYQHKLCTLVTTNRNKKMFVSRLGERIAGRILEKGLTLALNWPSYR